MLMNTLTSGIATLSGIGDALGLGSSDPVKDRERIARIDTAAAAALAGSRRDYVQLACWAGAAQGSPTYAEAVTYGMVAQGQTCGMPDSVRPYAQRKLAEVDTRMKVTPILAGAQDALADAATQQFVNRAQSWLPTIAVVGLALVAVWFLARRS